MKRHLWFIYFCSLSAQALSPIQALIEGDFTGYFKEEQSRPLNYIFRPPPAQIEESSDQNDLIKLFNLVLEGENLNFYCRAASTIRYPTDWAKFQAMRSVASTLQYIGLDLAVSKLAQLGKLTNLSAEDYEKLVNHLVTSSCSKNISVISLKSLKINFIQRYESDERPYAFNKFLPKTIKELEGEANVYRKEMMSGIKLFRSFCSWGGQVDDWRMLSFYLKDPIIMAFVARQLSGQVIDQQSWSDLPILRSEENNVRVACDNFICRKQDEMDFKKLFPKSFGHLNYWDDVNRLYCQEFVTMNDYQTTDEETIEGWIKETSLEEIISLRAELLGLISGVGNLYHAISMPSDFKRLVRASLDQSFNQWSESAQKNYHQNITYEGPLTITPLVSEDAKDWQLDFSIDQGVLDASSGKEGKIQVADRIRLPHNLIREALLLWQKRDPRKPEIEEKLDSILKRSIEEQFKDLTKLLVFEGQQEALANFVAQGLKQKIAQLNYSEWREISDEFIAIDLNFYFAPFALENLHFRHEMRKKRSFYLEN